MANVLSTRNVLAALLLAGCGAANATVPLAAPPPAAPTASADTSSQGSSNGAPSCDPAPDASTAPPAAQPAKPGESPYSSAEIADPEVIGDDWRPKLSISTPFGWRTVAYKDLAPGEYAKVADAKHDASIVLRTNPSKGSASEESLALQTEMVSNGQGWRVTEMSRPDNSDSYVEFALLGPNDERVARVAVRHYGQRGQVSVTFIGQWPKEHDHTSNPDYRGFVNGTSLLSEK